MTLITLSRKRKILILKRRKHCKLKVKRALCVIDAGLKTLILQKIAIQKLIFSAVSVNNVDMLAKYVLKNKLPLIFVLSSMSEKIPTKCPTIKFSLNDAEFVGMLDTGCSHSIIKFDSLPQSAKILPCNIQLNDCSTQLQIFGETFLEVKIGDLIFRKKNYCG